MLCCKRSLQHCASARCCLPLSSSGCSDPSSPTSGNWDLFYPSFSSPESFFLPPLHPHILRAQQGWLGRAALRAECSSLRSGAGLCCFASAHPCSSTWSRARLFAASCFPAGAVRLGARHRAHLGAFSHCCPQPVGAAPNLGLFTCLGTSSCCWHLWRRWSS